jgi:antitoxin component of RelBE/YafQ-DinJ toxin-antitoxin module
MVHIQMPYGPTPFRRTRVCKIRLTEKERKRLEDVAEAMELPISEAFRALVKEKAKKLGLT